MVVDIHYRILAERLLETLEPISDGEDRITGEEVGAIRTDFPDIPAGLVDALAQKMNDHADGYIISGQDVVDLADIDPQRAEEILAGLGGYCRGPGGIKMFSPDAMAFLEGTCQNHEGEAVSLVRGLGFSIAEGESTDEEETGIHLRTSLDSIKKLLEDDKFVAFIKEVQRRHRDHGVWTRNNFLRLAGYYENQINENWSLRDDPLFHDDFVRFADFMRETYRMDVFDMYELGLGIYQNPTLYASYRNPKIIAIFQRLDDIFSFPEHVPDAPRGLLEGDHFLRQLVALEKLGGRKDEDLKKVKEIADALMKAYPGRIRVENPDDVDWLLRIMDMPGGEERLRAYADPKVVAFDAFTRRHFGEGAHCTFFEDYFINLAQAFGGHPEDLLILKKCDPRLITYLLRPKRIGGPDIEKVQRIFPFLSDQSILERVRQFGADSWDKLETVIRLGQHPKGDEIISVARAAGGESLSSIGLLIDASDDPVLWARIKQGIIALSTCVERVWIGYDLLEWLKQPQVAALIQSGEPCDIARSLRVVWGWSNISIDEIREVLDLPLAKRKLLDDPTFYGQFKLMVSVFGFYHGMGELIQALTIGPEGVEAILSPESRSTISTLQRLYPETYNYVLDNDYSIEHYYKALSLGLGRFVQALAESGVIGEEGALWYPPEISHFLRVLKKYPKLAEMAEASKSSLKDAVRNKTISFPCMDSLAELLELCQTPKAFEALSAIKEMIGHPIRYGGPYGKNDEQLAITLALKRKDKTALFSDPDFLAFCKRVSGELLVPVGIEPLDIPILIDLYDARRELFSGRFKELIETLRDDFGINLIRASVLPPLLSIAASYDRQRMNSFVKKLGTEPRVSDIVFLNSILNDEELTRLVADRQALEREVRAVYDREARPRLDGEKEGYSERPPIGELDNVALLRLALLRHSLEDEDALSEIGAIVAKDIRDKTTEYGGVIELNGRLLRLRNVTSISEDDEAYGNILKRFLEGGVMSFHLHALEENESFYSGPSGPMEGYGGDWGSAKVSGETGVVITTCGRVRESPNELWINVDMYYYDADGKARVIDMGLYKIPVPSP